MHRSRPLRRQPTPRPAFTLVELMVVVAIVGILVGLLVPALGMARATMRATKSQSNLRQWGTALVGWANMNEERVPWEGAKNIDGMPLNLPNPAFWPNALAPMLGLESFRDMCDRAFAEQRTIDTWDNPESVWNDPAAQPDAGEPWSFGDPGKGGMRRQFWFSYAMNIRLNNTLLTQAGMPEFSTDALIRLSNVAFADKTEFMLELRATPEELPPDDPHRTRNLDRAACSWKRFASRHGKGGHILHADGHVGWYGNEDATTNAQGSRDPATPGGDWNTSKLIWDPLGPARN